MPTYLTGSFNVNWLVEEDMEIKQIPDWLASLLKEMKVELKNSSLPGKIPLLQIAHKLALTCSTSQKDNLSLQYDGLLWLIHEFKEWLFQTIQPMTKNHQKFRRNLILADLACTTITGLTLFCHSRQRKNRNPNNPTG